MSFQEKFIRSTARNESLVCVGLDPDPKRLPDPLRAQPDAILTFLKEIVHATKDLVCAYKPNFAFYGALGKSGWDALTGVLETIPEDIPTILDYKAGDIPNTASRYAAMAYGQLGVDAVTLNPLLGRDAVMPFLDYKDRCAFLLCLTSNPGSEDLQRLRVSGKPLYEILARKAVTWSAGGPCGLVVGATHPDEMKEIRKIAPDLPILVPGIGAQGGEAEAVITNGKDADGGGILVNVSRSVLYASGKSDFAKAARRAAESLRQRIEAARSANSAQP